MKTSIYLQIALKIILLTVIGIIGTYIPEQLHEFFGDTLITELTQRHNYDNIGEYYWGARHIWYNIGVVFLFMLTLINTIISTVKLLEKEYPKTF